MILLIALIAVYLVMLILKTGFLTRLMVASIMTQIISTINTFNYLPDSAVISLADGTMGLRVTVIAFELIVLFVALFYLITFSSTSPFLMMAHFVGIIALLSSRDWLVAIPAWEILNLSLYLLAGVRGLQYFLISALSTTLLIGGVAIIYSLTGVTHFETIQLTQNFSLGVVLVMIALVFKLGGPFVPF